MTLLALFLTGTLTTGCATTYSLPAWPADPVAQLAVKPAPPCEWPDIRAVNLDGTAGGFLDTPALLALKACRATADSHYELAQANAEAVEALAAALNKTNQTGQQYADHATFMLNQVDSARRDAVIEAWSYKGILAAVLIALAL